MIAPSSDRPAHIFTVDVEDYFQAGALETRISRAQWEAQPRRIVPTVERLLEMLDRFGAKATFFCLGWIGDRYPDLIHRIADSGHEIGAHGWWHKCIAEYTPGTFRDEVRAAKDRLEMESGQQVVGFRAPNFSLVEGTEWALDVLVEEGYLYDSSVLPLRRHGSGYPRTLPRPQMLHRRAGPLLEVPVSTMSLLGRRWVAAGGNYFRQLPYGLTRSVLRQAEIEGHPGVFYIHPWEVDPEQPRLNVGLKTRIRHYRGLRRNPKRLERLLSEFRFEPVRDRLLTPGNAYLIGLDTNGSRAPSDPDRESRPRRPEAVAG